jgi:molybdenum cofactor biosynthesis enzyme MoaA
MLSKHFGACAQLRTCLRKNQVPTIEQSSREEEQEQIAAALDQVLADKPDDPGFQAVSATSEDDEDESSEDEDTSDVESNISMGSIPESGAETEEVSSSSEEISDEE